MEATALASTLGVSEGEYAAFAEYVKAVSEKLGTRALSTQHVRAWRTDLAACPARASVLTFAQEVSTRIDEAAAASARVRQSIFASLMFTCIYGKNAHGERLQFEVALQRVLDQVVERASAEPPTQPLQYVPGKYGAAHAAVRAAAYPYTPACASDINHTTVDCIDANGGLLGYVCVDEDFGYLDDLCVLPRAQGYGIAACLVVQAAKSLVERRVDTISLHVRAANLPARRLYSALGFAEGDNEYPSWYDWHGGFHLEAESALVAAHSRGGSLNSGATAPARPLAMVASATALPAFVSLFATEAAAYRASRSQTGASNCGATAVATALDAIGVPTRAGAKDVTVRSRDYATLSLLKYLRSRSNAGCTAADLVEGAGSVSGGGAVAHFFPTGPLPPHGLCGWLAEWLALGAAPIATINTQLDGADYWHHQAVLGVKPHAAKILLANPAEEVDEVELARLLGSGSTMLIRRPDVLQRCPAPAEELDAMRRDPLWAQYAVAEQIEALVAREGGHGDGRRAACRFDDDEAKLRIPASYTPGLTLIAPTGSEAAQRIATQRGEGAVPWQHDATAMHQ